MRETWGNNTLIPLYDNEDSVCGIVYNDEPYYFQKNLQGDVVTLIGKDAKPVARYAYDAWGVCTVASDTSGVNVATVNPFRYRGYYYDSEIGLYYLQSDLLMQMISCIWDCLVHLMVTIIAIGGIIYVVLYSFFCG